MNGVSITEFGSSCDVEVGKALKMIEEQLSLNDEVITELEPFLGNDEDWSACQDYEGEVSAQNQLQACLHGTEENGFSGNTLHHLPGI